MQLLLMLFKDLASIRLAIILL